MSYPDVRGNPCSSASRSAHAAAEQALWRMMSFYGAPLDDLDDAIAADPGWMLPHVMKAGFLLSLTEALHTVEAERHLGRARLLASTQATARERAHLEAVQMVAQGRWHVAC